MVEGTVIRAEGLSHAFGAGEARSQVLWDIDLGVRRGEFIVLRGASGSGKTTLLTLLACLREVQDGSVRLFGQELAGADEAELTALRGRLGFIFQAHNLHPALTALQNVRMGLELHGRPAMRDWRRAAAQVLGLLGLGDRLHYRPASLSGGQKQRVAIARALVAGPEVVFADEPTAALDAEAALRVVGLLRRLGRERGTTTVMVTHDDRLAEQADRVVTLDGGRIAKGQG